MRFEHEPSLRITVFAEIPDESIDTCLPVFHYSLGELPRICRSEAPRLQAHLRQDRARRAVHRSRVRVHPQPVDAARRGDELVQARAGAVQGRDELEAGRTAYARGVRDAIP